MIKSIILSGLRVHANISREIYYSIDSFYMNNKSHSGPVQYVLTLKTNPGLAKSHLQTHVATHKKSPPTTVIIDLTPDILKQPTLHDQVHYSLIIKSSCKYKS